MSEQCKEIHGHPLDDWRFEVCAKETMLGYGAWVHARIEGPPDPPNCPNCGKDDQWLFCEDITRYSKARYCEETGAFALVLFKQSYETGDGERDGEDGDQRMMCEHCGDYLDKFKLEGDDA